MIAPNKKTFDRPVIAAAFCSPPAFDLCEIALLLDVDGTLLDLAARPDEVRVPEDLRAALKDLSASTHCVVALVSGRPAAQLDALFFPVKLALVGCHGAEMRKAPNAPVCARIPLDEDIRAGLYALAAHLPGTLLEDKKFSVAIHYRGAPALEAPLLAAANEFANAHPELELLAGKAVIEFKPRGYDKATACAELLAHSPFAGRTPVFLGDDVTDERVFRVLPEFCGIGISVGRAMHGAQYMLRSPAEVRSWLRGLVAQRAQ